MVFVFLPLCVAALHYDSYAYVTLATTNDTWCAAHVLAESIFATKTPYRVVIMHPGHTTFPRIPLADRVRYHEIHTMAKAEGNTHWKPTYNKFWAARLLQYTRVVFMDADMIVMRNMDHLFRYQLAAPTAYWLGRSYLSSGLMVLTPNPRLFSDVLESSKGRRGQDMDYFNAKVKNSAFHLDPKYNALIGQHDPNDKGAYNKLEQTIYAYHFIANYKPFFYDKWQNLNPEGEKVYALWWELADILALPQLCPNWDVLYDKYNTLY